MAQMPVQEFVELGLLQEVNRRFFHPAGMELTVNYSEYGGDLMITGIHDARGNPEGLVFGDGHQPAPHPEYADRYDAMVKAGARTLAYGYVIQPVHPPEPVIVDSVTRGMEMPKELK